MTLKLIALSVITTFSTYSYAKNSVIGLDANVSTAGKTRTQLNITDINALSKENNRFLFKNISEFFPTKTIDKGTKEEFIFKKNLKTEEIDELDFEFLNLETNKKEKSKIKDMLFNTRTDSFIVVKDGVIVYENYFDGQNDRTRHIIMSVSKSLTGLLVASLIDEGKLNPNAKVSEYIPELKKSGYADATVQQILDMLIHMKYSEEYANPNAEINNYGATLGSGEYSPNYKGEKSIRGFLATLQKVNIGKEFHYATPTTDVMCWLAEKATNTPVEKIMEQRIWSTMGMTRDAFVVNDAKGTISCGGGFNVTALDLAKIGVMLSNKGEFNGAQILPKSVIEKLMDGGDKNAYKKLNSTSVFKSYKNQFWIVGNKNKAFSALGISGQWVYVDPTEKVVIIKQSSLPQADSEVVDVYTSAGFNAIIDKLKN
ncbi:serine hydrolase domain-containing protein [Fluviispira vulneris]|uniref:serine hydrolase domain-containing protein n=1 Tax=Fluviispira vulneris TaxID=2763012 RepID=UPI001648E173|nr:serine hydrolase [Fluviispira vulneris]